MVHLMRVPIPYIGALINSGGRASTKGNSSKSRERNKNISIGSLPLPSHKEAPLATAVMGVLSSAISLVYSDPYALYSVALPPKLLP